jgi:hypothetical protein
MLTEEIALKIAQSWIEAWNLHDVNKIMVHYAEDVEVESPLILKLLDDLAGVSRGKTELKSYYSRALARYPEIHLELLQVLMGIDYFAIYYRTAKGLICVDQLHIDSAGLIFKVEAHYGIMNQSDTQQGA